MQVAVNGKALSKALDDPNARIVLGSGANRLAHIMLGIWVAAVAGMVLFFWSAMAAMPGVPPLDVRIPIGILTGAVAWAYLLGGWRSRFSVDLTDRSYQHEFGLPPLMRRRRGHLDAYSHLSLTRQMQSHGMNGSTVAIWKLTLVPQAAASPPEPIQIAFAWWGAQSATAIPVLSERLANRLGLPLRDESEQVAPEPKTPAWVGILILCLFVGFVGSIAAYKAYASRGPRFPATPGAVQVLNAPLGPCRVRTLEVTAGRSYTTHSTGGGGPDGGGGGGSVTHTFYTVALDIENPGANAVSTSFVVGFNADSRAEGSTGPLAPHAHRLVSVELDRIGDPPSDLFLREEN